MSDPTASRFTTSNKTTNERLSTTTVGLVALADFRKRRAEVLEQQEREAREAVFAGPSKPDRSQTGTPDNGSESGTGGEMKKQKKEGQGDKKGKGKGKKKKLLSFDDGEENESSGDTQLGGKNAADEEAEENKAKIKANAAIGVVPRAVTKAALLKEAAEREALRREFVALQEAVKATEIALPFVFYDGTNIPAGMVRVKKGDFVWVFLDKSRRVGAELRVGEQPNALRAWARVGVDDLMLVRGTVIIPHHYDFYYFIMNKCVGPGGKTLFSYSTEAVTKDVCVSESARTATSVVVTAETKAAAARALPDIKTLEGATDDPTLTKVVDRRWYERHKHIYPASTWQKFDPEKDYAREIRKDGGGNTFFFSK